MRIYPTKPQEDFKMVETILTFVQSLLEYLKEFEAAGIIELVKEFIAGLLG